MAGKQPLRTDRAAESVACDVLRDVEARLRRLADAEDAPAAALLRDAATWFGERRVEVEAGALDLTGKKHGKRQR